LSHLRHNLDSLAHSLKQLGIEHVVISPGSRNAPMIAGFLRIGGFNLLSAPDERAAAFMALGAAQATGKPAVVLCTSGTAVLNLYPGICEAYYQRVPLIAISADRPENLIDQWDGQTIRQKDIFEKHILRSFHLTADIHAKETESTLAKMAAEAWHASMERPKGPVHINIPLAEPIYEGLDAEKSANFINPPKYKIEKPATQNIPGEVLNSRKTLWVVGQHPPSESVNAALKTISQHAPVLADVLSNVQGGEIVNGIEKLHLTDENQTPDVLITLGLSMVSKSLNQHLRNLHIQHHIHLGDGGFTGDPFFSKPQTLQTDVAGFMHQWLKDCAQNQDSAFLSAWQYAFENQIQGDTEAELVHDVIRQIPRNACLQLGNSMVVRHANRCNNLPDFVFGNRGSSGIDGSVSTAVGYAWAKPQQRVYCITGDIGFLYDKNAWWCNPMPQNLLVIIINNGGGMIFDRLHGPEKMPELRPFVHTPHDFTAKSIAEHYQIPYRGLKAPELGFELRNIISATRGIIEIFTS